MNAIQLGKTQVKFGSVMSDLHPVVFVQKQDKEWAELCTLCWCSSRHINHTCAIFSTKLGLKYFLDWNTYWTEIIIELKYFLDWNTFWTEMIIGQQRQSRKYQKYLSCERWYQLHRQTANWFCNFSLHTKLVILNYPWQIYIKKHFSFYF